MYVVSLNVSAFYIHNMMPPPSPTPRPALYRASIRVFTCLKVPEIGT